MNNDFIRLAQNGPRVTDLQKPHIPQSAYQSIKRCKYCNSVYITESHCEECGRSFSFHSIGEPFSFKSFYGIKEKYIEDMSFFSRVFSSRENIKSPKTKRYIKKLDKRFNDLIEAYVAMDDLVLKNARLFYIELQAIVEELIRYEVNPLFLIQIIETKLVDESYPQMGSELIGYIKNHSINHSLKRVTETKYGFYNYSLIGIKVDKWAMVLLIVAAVVAATLIYYSQKI